VGSADSISQSEVWGDIGRETGGQKCYEFTDDSIGFSRITYLSNRRGSSNTREAEK
jgi:hypothetical protein